MPRWWPWGRAGRVRNDAPPGTISISDPTLAGWFGMGSQNWSGAPVNETTAMGLSGFWRAIALISGTLASLELMSLRDDPAVPGQPQRVTSIFDDPQGPDGPTVFEWKETVFAHMLLHGNAFLYRARNYAGAVQQLIPFHPLAVRICRPTLFEYQHPELLPVGGKWFDISLDDGSFVRWDGTQIMHIPFLSLDGFNGLSVLAMARNSIGIGVAGDRAAGRMFDNGAMISGIVSPDGDDIDGWDGKKIKSDLDMKVAGWEHAGEVAVVNRRLKFDSWTMTAADAQFLQQRQYSIEEVSRWTGVPPHLLMQTDKQSSWGTGIAEQERGMSRTVLAPWASRFEARGSRELKQSNRYVRFDFTDLERPTPEILAATTQANYNAGLTTLNEARGKLHLPPVAGGDTFVGAAAPALPPGGAA